jgi:hypothetical protein
MLKGTLVGTVIFATGFSLYLAAFMRQEGPRYPKAGERLEEMSPDVFTLVRYFILQSPLFCAAFVSALLIGCSLVTF